MSATNIRSVLETKLNNWAKAQTPTIPVSFENVGFTKPTTGTYVEAFMLPNKTFDVDVSGQHKRYIGIFQINCWAKQGKGMGEVEQLAQSIVNLYPLLPKDSVVSIDATPNTGAPIYDPSGWIVIPVTIKYRLEA